jgi:hypothetical protein
MHYFYMVMVVVFVAALLVIGFVMDREDQERED